MGGLQRRRPDARAGIATSLLAVAAATAAIYPLKEIAPTASLSVVYLPAVLLVSTYWGLWFGLGTSLLATAAFNFFHIPPVGKFTIADSHNWVALGAFTIVAAVVSTIAELARSRAVDAERGRREADLAAALTTELLAGVDTEHALAITARLLATALGMPSAAIELGSSPGDRRRRALPLQSADGEQLATLLVPANLPADLLNRLRTRIAPSLEALIAIALRRDTMQAEAVETAALRRSDDVKTALLRAVSHDLRTPLTAIVAAGHALRSDSLSAEDRTELSAAVVEEGARLARLVDKLLDLSKLQAGGAVPRREWVSLEEVVLAARDGSSEFAGELRLTIDPDVPEIRADAAQLERAFANLLENARRYGGAAPVSVRVRRVGRRVLISVVDQGPGITPAELERIFEPFYRGTGDRAREWTGSGLGLAIAKGFVEANAGTIAVQSLPGQGTTFVVSLPISEKAAAEDPAAIPA
jgi:two-component system, OmpR family, sensor histidine kinase KdpD